MKSLADAVVYAVIYIDLREDPEEHFLEDDVSALESIAYSLHKATQEEKNALADAANRGLAEEKSSDRPREKFIQAYEKWMENVFNDDEWTGNNRNR